MPPLRGTVPPMRVLLATDGSERSHHAAQQALRLFGADHDWVVATAIAIEPWIGIADAGGIEGPLYTPEEMEQARVESQAAAEAILTEAVGALGLTGADQRVEKGDPGDAICRLAEEIRPDVVVVGSHGRGIVRRALLGSVSDYIVRHAPCPVLVVRDTES
jgi:nucleotide-binding universal stress UspA family protein